MIQPAAGAHPHDDEAAAQRGSTEIAVLDELHRLRDEDPAEMLRRWPAAVAALPPADQGDEALLLHAQAELLRSGAELWRHQLDAALASCRAASQRLGGVSEALTGTQRLQRLRVQALNLEGFIANRAGRLVEASRLYLQCIAQTRAAGDGEYEAQVQVNLANVYEEAGLDDQALAHHRAALELARQFGLRELQADIAHNIGNAMAGSGESSAALRSHQQAFDTFAELGLARKQTVVLMGIAERELELRRPADARARLLKLRDCADHQRFPFAEAYAAELLARADEDEHGAAAAHEAWAHALATNRALAFAPGVARSLAGCVRGELARGRNAAATAQVDELLALVRSTTGTLREQEQALQLASMVAEAQGNHAAALAHAREHQQVYRRLFNERSALAARMLAVRHELELAQAEAERYKLESARLNEALLEVAARLRALERASGSAAAAPQGPQALRSLGLTAREAEVLYWVSLGKTNTDVAAILDTGMAAVKKHLGHIYEKLGVENRTAAAAAARRRTAA